MFFFLLLQPYLSIRLFLVSYRIFPSLFTCRCDLVRVRVLLGSIVSINPYDCIYPSVSLLCCIVVSLRSCPSLSRVVWNLFPSLYVSFLFSFLFVFFSIQPYLSICSFVLLPPTPTPSLVVGSWNRYFIRFECTSLASRSFYHCIRHVSINRYGYLSNVVQHTAANLCIRTDPDPPPLSIVVVLHHKLNIHDHPPSPFECIYQSISFMRHPGSFNLSLYMSFRSCSCSCSCSSSSSSSFRSCPCSSSSSSFDRIYRSVSLSCRTGSIRLALRAVPILFLVLLLLL